MAIETFEYIDDLNVANPTATDNVSEGDDHLRGLKTTLKNTFPNVTGAINATETELNVLDMSAGSSTSGQVLTSTGTGTVPTWQDSGGTLDSPSITGTLFVDNGSTVSHTISNWSDDITYTITPTNCTVGSVNSSGVFVVTHTSGTPSYTIKATTTSLGLDDSALVTKNIALTVAMTAPSLNAPADVEVDTAVTYTISSIDANATKVIFDTQSSNFTYGSVGSGSGSKVGNTVEITGWSGTSVTVTLTYTTAATYSNRAKVQSTADAYTDSAYSSTDSIIISSPAVWYGGRGVFGGGYNSNVIDYITIQTTSDATDFGNLTTIKNGPGGCSSGSRGCFGGGSDASVNILYAIDYITISTTGNATDFGDLTANRNSVSACSDGTIGVFGGGWNSGVTDTIDYITIATTSNATDFGNLTFAKHSPGGCSDSSRGVFGGGTTNAAKVNAIDYITIATTSDATDFGDLTVARFQIGSCSDATRGIFGGGELNNNNNTIDYITIATTSNATDFGNLTVALTANSACSDGTYGVFGGGHSGGALNTMEYVTIQTTGNATDFGDLTVARYNSSSCSGD